MMWSFRSTSLAGAIQVMLRRWRRRRKKEKKKAVDP
jgi:hypothetical protein